MTIRRAGVVLALTGLTAIVFVFDTACLDGNSSDPAVCGAGRRLCNGDCVPIDEQNCQRCGDVCGAGSACVDTSRVSKERYGCEVRPGAPPPEVAPIDAALPDAAPAVDAGGCGPNRPFSTIVPVGGLPGSGTSTDSNIKLSADELSAYFSSDRSGTTHIYFATRAATTAPFAAAAEVTSLSDVVGERWASPSASGLFAIVERNSRLYEASRAATAAPWSTPTAPPELNQDDMAFPLTTGLPHLMPDGNTLYFSRLVVTSYDIFKSTRSGVTWSAPVPVTEANVAGVNDWAPTLTPDGLTMYFGSSRGSSGDSGADARSSIWVATRASVNDPFGAPRKVTEVDQGTDAFPSWVSADNCRLYFSKKVDLGGAFPAYRSYVASQ